MNYTIGVVPTVKVKDPNKEGFFMIINETDFDAKTMQLYGVPEKAEAKPDKVVQETDPPKSELQSTAKPKGKSKPKGGIKIRTQG